VSDSQFEIPDRAFFKASEVCEIAQVQAYVLRTWELEFPSLGVPRPGGGQRIYRRQDLERVLAIKQLVFSEGLTLAGARRRLEGDMPAEPDDLSVEALVTPEVRDRLTSIKRGLRSLLALLGPGENADRADPGRADEPPFSAGDGELFPRDDVSAAPLPRLTMARPARARAAKPRGKGTRQGKARRR
jgi:DNA-binding transcriptional MerR regulator